MEDFSLNPEHLPKSTVGRKYLWLSAENVLSLSALFQFQVTETQVTLVGDKREFIDWYTWKFQRFFRQIWFWAQILLPGFSLSLFASLFLPYSISPTISWWFLFLDSFLGPAKMTLWQLWVCIILSPCDLRQGSVLLPTKVNSLIPISWVGQP